MFTIEDLAPLTAEEEKFVAECNELAMGNYRIAQEILDNRKARPGWNAVSARQRVGGTFGT